MTSDVGSKGEQTRSASAAPSAAVPPELQAFVLCAGLLGINADPWQLAHERGRGMAPFSLEDFARLAPAIGVMARLRGATQPQLAGLPLPAMIETSGGNAIILLKVDAGADHRRYLVQRGDSGHPEIWTEADLADQYRGRALLLASRETQVGDRRPFDISWFIPAIVRYRKPLRDVLVASIFLQLVGLATPIFFQLVIDKVLVHQTLSTLNVLAFGLAVLLIFETAMSGLRVWLLTHTTNRMDSELSSRLVNHMLNLPLAYFEVRRTGDSVARVRELENIREFLTSNAIILIIDILFTAIFFAVMFLYSVKLTAIVLVSVPLYIAISRAIAPRLQDLLEEKFQRSAENQSFLVEAVAGIGTLKAMAAEPQMRDRWERLFANYATTGFAAAKLANVGSHLIQLVSKLTTVAILYFGAKAVIAGSLSVGALVAFNMLAGRVAAPILRLSQLWQDFQQIRISVDRLGDVLNAPPEPIFSAGGGTLPAIRGRVDIDHVHFRYRPDAPEVLRGIDMAVAAGEMLGIVGPSGSGKSTLAKLVQRLYVPERGRVRIDEMDVALADPAWLRRQVGVVLQENILFNRTVRDNIALTDPAIPLERIIEVARLAGAHDFILEMPRGYDTVVEERGANLSGGQRQRIAIARALAADPRILIFDEATSALDAESEAVIQANLAAIAAGRTMIIIAHRLSAVRRCDRILTIEDGIVTEMGNHNELLAAGGRYAQLYALQHGGQI